MPNNTSNYIMQAYIKIYPLVTDDGSSTTELFDIDYLIERLEAAKIAQRKGNEPSPIRFTSCKDRSTLCRAKIEINFVRR